MKEEKHYYVYIATNQRNTVLYTGITSKLIKRQGQHLEKIFRNSFTAKYNINKVVYYEVFGTIGYAIAREKQIKAGSRKKKIDLIESLNPGWKDIMEDI